MASCYRAAGGFTDLHVNGEEVSEDRVLAHNDRITVGEGSITIEFAKPEQAATAG